MNINIKINLKPKAFNMWLITTMFAFIQFFLQIVFAAMTNDVMSAYSIGATAAGVLSSTFFYTFIILQVPAGILLDRFNIRYIITLASTLCGIGCIIFGLAPNYTVAVLGRLLMGVGGTFGFLGMTKVVRLWYKKDQFALMVGMSELLANLTAAFGIGVATFFIVRFGWRGNMVAYGLIVLILAVVSFIFLRQPENTKKPRTYRLSVRKQIIMVLRKPQCWLACLYALGMFSIVTTFCALWGLPFLVKMYGLSNEMAGIGISIVFIGLAMGCPIIGFMVNAIGNVKNIMIVCSFVSVVIMAIIIYPVVHYTDKWLYLLLFLLGLFGSSYFLSFEKMKHLVHESVQGIAMALCNMSAMMGALIFQPMIGFFLQVGIPKSQHHLHESYTSSQYQHAIIIMLLVLIMAFVVSFFIKTQKSLPKPEKPKLN
jgi:MFS family permease